MGNDPNVARPQAPFCDELLTPEQAAALLGIPKQTLAKWRCTRVVELEYIKLGHLVRYERSAIHRFIEAGRVHSRGTSRGATTALRPPASAWGGPDFMQRWRATDNALESLASQHSEM